MIYSTSICPHCKNIISQKTNPVKEIANPFEKCPLCGEIYKNSYKEEWITKSPLKRFLFFIQGPVWARALIIPLLCCSLFLQSLETSVIWLIWLCGFFIWITLAWFFYRNKFQESIETSLERTKNKDYLELLVKSGYKIYPITSSIENNQSHDEEISKETIDDIKDEIVEDYEYDKHGYADELDKINTPNKDECPCCFSKISVNDKECSYCGYKLK